MDKQAQDEFVRGFQDKLAASGFAKEAAGAAMLRALAARAKALAAPARQAGLTAGRAARVFGQEGAQTRQAVQRGAELRALKALQAEQTAGRAARVAGGPRMPVAVPPPRRPALPAAPVTGGNISRRDAIRRLLGG